MYLSSLVQESCANVGGPPLTSGGHGTAGQLHSEGVWWSAAVPPWSRAGSAGSTAGRVSSATPTRIENWVEEWLP